MEARANRRSNFIRGSIAAGSTGLGNGRKLPCPELDFGDQLRPAFLPVTVSGSFQQRNLLFTTAVEMLSTRSIISLIGSGQNELEETLSSEDRSKF